jgi:hypothetical protein
MLMTPPTEFSGTKPFSIALGPFRTSTRSAISGITE